jgi:hypothetical protein
MTQWHPLFAQLLRPLLEGRYEVQTGVAVGDAPRQADIVLLRRTAAGPPFGGLWRWLTAWNVLEFKGPSVSARVGDLDDLVELGLGVQRRLNEEQAKQRQPEVGREEASFWYLANHLGRRFLASARELLGPLEELAAGVWRASVLRRAVVLVSNREVAVERDSLPLHLLTPESQATRHEVAQVLGASPDLLRTYQGWAGMWDPQIVRELERMGKKLRTPVLDLRPWIQDVGWPEIIKQGGIAELAAQMTDEQRRELGAHMTDEQLREMLADLSDERRRQLLRLLQGAPPPPAGKRKRK